MTSRAVVETDIRQGADEELYYSITTTPWGSSPSSVAAKAYDVDNADNDVSATVLSGSASVNGDVITLPKVKSLTAGRHYRIEVKFTSGSSIFECYFVIEAED